MARNRSNQTRKPRPRTGEPAPAEKGVLRLIPLGGLGEVGRNMHVLEFDGRMLIIDCGVLFPDPDQPGIDVILPDFAWIADRLDDVEGIVLTHGHEDHIGGVPYLLQLRPDIPLIGSGLTLALISAKLQEYRIKPVLRTVREGDRVHIGTFDCEFAAVNHSIPDGLAVFVRTAGGTVLNTGDFKMDQFPLDERITDLRAFARFGEEGVDVFMPDSTNAEVPGFTTGERDLAPAIAEVFRTSPKRIIVSSFASHVHRIQQVIDAAQEHGRKVAFVGRSMVRNMGIARDLGYLKIPEGVLVDHRDLTRMPDNKTVLICTGSQGEPMAALARIAKNDHQIKVGPGDTVLLASSLIPGNESSIYNIINQLSELGANVVHKGNAKVHTSGHASAGELAYCHNIIKPRNVLPIHGEWRHLDAQASIAKRTGVPEDHVVVVRDGAVIDLVKGRIQVVGQVPARQVFVEGGQVDVVNDDTLAERRALAEDGMVTVLLFIDPKTGNIVEDPEYISKGTLPSDEEFQELTPKIQKALHSAVAAGRTEQEQLEHEVRRTVTNWFQRGRRSSPVVIPVVVDA
ncbi:ribonuclease J [Luteococcus japonicus]|uniref:Ribonuclease J n=1 Tax=Luteococcus japonicus TaxID=33984 RepID=A0A3N1ZXV7_9ACTN|nr:ribonuclease J [Luteococcus japonicus]ROR55317.1 ribonuclease J [Luteococcus japonicus]